MEKKLACAGSGGVVSMVCMELARRLSGRTEFQMSVLGSLKFTEGLGRNASREGLDLAIADDVLVVMFALLIGRISTVAS